MYTIAPFQFGVWKLTCTYSRVQTLLHPEWSKSDDVTYYLFRACRSGSPRRISDEPSLPAVTVLAAARLAPRQAAVRKRPGPHDPGLPGRRAPWSRPRRLPRPGPGRASAGPARTSRAAGRVPGPPPARPGPAGRPGQRP